MTSLSCMAMLSTCDLSHAEETSPSGGDTVRFDTVVVTGTGSGLSKMRSSAAVSTMDADRILQSVPGNAADVLRNVPGVIVQASGGEGNANISARGLPQSGGAKRTQFQEDGMPVLEFGDIDFATADTFLRLDSSIDRLEVIRGGSAATYTSNAPGGVFNFISKTGDVAGGHIGLSRGLDFDETRLDADYGQPIDARSRFHVGAFLRSGEGPRSVGYNAERGGQIKGNLTHDFDAGYLRLYFKLLNDRTPVYLPVPVFIGGSNETPRPASLTGFDVRDGAMQSPYFRDDLAVDADGRTVHTDVADGYYSNSRSLGLEAAFDIGAQWKLRYKGRLSRTSGRFVGPYPAQVDSAAALAESIGGPGASLRYATGPQAGQAITDPGALNGNGLATRTLLFNTTLNDLGYDGHDLQASRRFVLDHSVADVRLGYYRSRQRIAEDWHWNTYLQDVKGSGSALLDVVTASGQVVTQRGLVAYGEPVFGNCCVRFYDLTYDTSAPYASIEWQRGPLNLDGSLRWDIASAHGSYAGAGEVRPFDVDGDGVISPPESQVPIVDRDAAQPVDYRKAYLSYSFGANLLLDPDLAVFARQSLGARANAERVLFGGGIRADGDIARQVLVNKVKQTEGGVKWRTRGLSVFATIFYATTEETNQDVTSIAAPFASRRYAARGLELEMAASAGAFSLNGGLTWSRAKVTQDDITPAQVGQPINPKLMFQLAPSYHSQHVSVGLTIIGTTKNPSGPTYVPGFTQVNGYASFVLGKGLSLAVLGNNLFNTIGLTEIPNSDAGVAADGVMTGRSITGRTIKAMLTYSL